LNAARVPASTATSSGAATLSISRLCSLKPNGVLLWGYSPHEGQGIAKQASHRFLHLLEWMGQRLYLIFPERFESPSADLNFFGLDRNDLWPRPREKFCIGCDADCYNPTFGNAEASISRVCSLEPCLVCRQGQGEMLRTRFSNQATAWFTYEASSFARCLTDGERRLSNCLTSVVLETSCFAASETRSFCAIDIPLRRILQTGPRARCLPDDLPCLSTGFLETKRSQELTHGVQAASEVR